jgi:hypothetical protein
VRRQILRRPRSDPVKAPPRPDRRRPMILSIAPQRPTVNASDAEMSSVAFGP